MKRSTRSQWLSTSRKSGEVYRCDMRFILFLVALALGVSVFVAVHFVDFPGSVPDFENITGGAVLLDMKPSFSQDEVYGRLAAYGEAGRKNYAFRNKTVDVLLPIGMLPILFLSMNAAIRKLEPFRVWRIVLLSVPFAYVIFDFGENAAVLAMLAHYPERLPLVAGILPYLTIIKRVSSMLALFGPPVIFGLVFLRARRISRA